MNRLRSQPQASPLANINQASLGLDQIQLPSTIDTDSGGLGWGGQSLGPNAVDMGVVSPQTAYGIENSFAHGLGFKGSRGNYQPTVQGLLTTPSLIKAPLMNLPVRFLKDLLFPQQVEPSPDPSDMGIGGFPGPDTATSGPGGTATGPLGGGVESFGPSGPGPAGVADPPAPSGLAGIGIGGGGFPGGVPGADTALGAVGPIGGGVEGFGPGGPGPAGSADFGGEGYGGGFGSGFGSGPADSGEAW